MNAVYSHGIIVLTVVVIVLVVLIARAGLGGEAHGHRRHRRDISVAATQGAPPERNRGVDLR